MQVGGQTCSSGERSGTAGPGPLPAPSAAGDGTARPRRTARIGSAHSQRCEGGTVAPLPVAGAMRAFSLRSPAVFAHATKERDLRRICHREGIVTRHTGYLLALASTAALLGAMHGCGSGRGGPAQSPGRAEVPDDPIEQAADPAAAMDEGSAVAAAPTVGGEATRGGDGSGEEAPEGSAAPAEGEDPGGASEAEQAAATEAEEEVSPDGEGDAEAGDAGTEAEQANASARRRRAARRERRQRRRRPEPGVVSGQLSGSRRYTANALVYVAGGGGRSSRTVTMDQRNHTFVPTVLPIVRGTTVRFVNSDNEDHNVFSPDNEGYDLGNWGGGEARSRTFARAGVYTQLCHLHPSMIGYVVVLENRHFTRVRGGSFDLRLPPGDHVLKAWSPRGPGWPKALRSKLRPWST